MTRTGGADTHGVCPRNFRLEADGDSAAGYGPVVRLANQDSQNLVSYPLSKPDGHGSYELGEPTVLELPGLCGVVVTAPVAPPVSAESGGIFGWIKQLFGAKL
eukprot:SAG31_NODE_9830_length_1222_cov_1.902048_2_plen_103_part_00